MIRKIIISLVLLSYCILGYPQHYNGLHITPDILIKIQKRHSSLIELTYNIFWNYAYSNMLPVSEYYLGMNGVPVLDQGDHGSCVTFATTAAIDAVLGKGDYISQYCLLQLGRYLEKNGYTLSGWEGAEVGNILHNITQYGTVNKANEAKFVCGEDKFYADVVNPKGYLPLDKYKRYSEESYISYEEIPMDYMAKALYRVKMSILLGNRVVIAMLILGDSDNGLDGTYNKYRDTWTLSSKNVNEGFSAKEVEGHALVVTGFNDNATVLDTEGHLHRGVLKVRNSWGKYNGDNGDYYISYDYFKAVAVNAYIIK